MRCSSGLRSSCTECLRIDITFCSSLHTNLPFKQRTPRTPRLHISQRRFELTVSAGLLPSNLEPSAEEESDDKRLVVVGGGAAGVFAAIRAKDVCPQLQVLVLEKGRPLSKVRISGGGRCNVTTALFDDPLQLAEQYPRGHKELRGSFFRTHGPKDTSSWFLQHGVHLKAEEDGRMFPVTDNSATIVDCLMSEIRRLGVVLQTGSSVTTVTVAPSRRFSIETGTLRTLKKTFSADYVLLATGSSSQGYRVAKQLGHTVVDPVPSLFTFKVQDPALHELAGVTLPNVRAELEVCNVKSVNSKWTQVGPLLVTHWGLSGPVVLRLSAWAARELYSSDYEGTLWVDFIPDMDYVETMDSFVKHKDLFLKRKLVSVTPACLPVVRRVWHYLLQRQGLDADMLWAGLSKKNMTELVSVVKRCPFPISAKGQFKEEFVTAGGVPLTEVNLKTMESRSCHRLFFAGEILNVDGVTGGFNFQNAWTGGFIAGSTIASRHSLRSWSGPRRAATVTRNLRLCCSTISRR